ncbi:phospholipid scramblase 2-like [Bradysia coprophila]|uniref:phospholipid scramblase 2-like n=1 Tax=Bradysia coprophila TaxID=38358 RepID=UPI00187DBCA4|nr:phospholipid scramblase 2-like [Bradysia coprophila]
MNIPTMDAHQRNYPPRYEFYDETSFTIVNQPSCSSRPNQTSVNRNYPRELEILNNLTTIVIEDVTLFCTCQEYKTYAISYQGTKIFTVRENTDCCTYCCTGNRYSTSLNFILYDLHENGIMSVFNTSGHFGNYVQVKIAGQIVGSIQRTSALLCRPKFLIRNANGEVIFKIKRVVCLPLCFWSEIDFFVYNMDDEEVGKITRHWTGCCNVSSDTFSIKFPRDADVLTKALLIGACLCVDFTSFETEEGTLV